MNIGKIIRMYRKEMGITQEEMAARLGVTTPAVNKWENGNTLPDIGLVAPIARLLGISTDELLSFKEDLTDEEVNIFIKNLDKRLKEEPFEQVFSDAEKKIAEYPNCDRLKWNTATILYATWLINDVKDHDCYVDCICQWFSQLLKSEDASIRESAAESLFRIYFRKEDYNKAEEYLSFLPENHPDRELLQADIYSKTGKSKEAYAAYEGLMLSAVNRLRGVVNALQVYCLEDNNLEMAHRIADLNGQIAKCFEMGPYQENASKLEIAAYEKNADETARIMQILIENCESVSDFTKSLLFSHLKFSQLDKEFISNFQQDLIKRFCDEEAFDYMKGNEYWESLAKND